MSYKLPPPPPHCLKRGDLAFSPDLSLKEFIVNIERGESIIEIELLNKGILYFKVKEKTWWMDQSPYRRITNGDGLIPVEMLRFFTEITMDVDRDYKLDKLFEDS